MKTVEEKDKQKLKVQHLKTKINEMYVGETRQYKIDAQTLGAIRKRFADERKKQLTGRVYSISNIGNIMYVTRYEDEPIR